MSECVVYVTTLKYWSVWCVTKAKVCVVRVTKLKYQSGKCYNVGVSGACYKAEASSACYKTEMTDCLVCITKLKCVRTLFMYLI